MLHKNTPDSLARRYPGSSTRSSACRCTAVGQFENSSSARRRRTTHVIELMPSEVQYSCPGGDDERGRKGTDLNRLRTSAMPHPSPHHPKSATLCRAEPTWKYSTSSAPVHGPPASSASRKTFIRQRVHRVCQRSKDHHFLEHLPDSVALSRTGRVGASPLVTTLSSTNLIGVCTTARSPPSLPAP
jgi:hypothetical protein